MTTIVIQSLVAFASLAGLPAVALSLRTLGLRRTCRLLNVPIGSETPESSAVSALEAGSLAQGVHLSVHRMARYLPLRLECLPRSIWTCALLRLFRQPSCLRISARRTATAIEAHAWVQFADAVLGEKPPSENGLQALA